MTAMTYTVKHPKTGVYYYRRAIPPELREAVGKGREWKASLHTKDVREAKRLASEMTVQVEDEPGGVPRKHIGEAIRETLGLFFTNCIATMNEEARAKQKRVQTLATPIKPILTPATHEHTNQDDHHEKEITHNDD